MKKCLAFLIAMLLALSFSPTALAESTESYYIEEIGMSVSIPSDLYVITRDVQEGDPALAVTGTTRDGALTFMKESDIYLNAFCLESNYEIVIIMQKNSLSDFRDLPDSGLKVLMSGLRDEYTKYGLNVIESSVYDHPQAKFLQFYASQSSDGGEAYVNQYYTIRDGKAINLTLRSYSGEVNDEMRARLKDVVDSVRFEEDSFVEAEPVQTEAFRYTDKETGLSFLVPANWEEKPMRQERQFLRCKFVSTEEPGVSIMYGGMDLWDAMSSAEKVGRTRADIDNSVFSAQEIAAVLGVSADEVETRTFGGKEYYLFEITSSANSYNISVTLTAAVRIENGTIYMIQFTGTGESPLYPDFEALLNSITYPESTETKRAEATPKPSIAPVVTVSMYPIQTAPQRSYGYDRYAARKPIYTLIGIALFALIPAFIAKKKGRSFWGYYFLCFLLSPLIVIIITLCLSDLTRAPRAVGQTTQYGQMWKYVCTNCGAGLQEPCTTCPYCGGVGFVRENRSAPYGQR